MINDIPRLPQQAIHKYPPKPICKHNTIYKVILQNLSLTSISVMFHNTNNYTNERVGKKCQEGKGKSQ